MNEYSIHECPVCGDAHPAPSEDHRPVIGLAALARAITAIRNDPDRYPGGLTELSGESTARYILAALESDFTVEDLGAIESCLRACANDPREPQRYRTWYAKVLAKVEAVIEARK